MQWRVQLQAAEHAPRLGAAPQVLCIPMFDVTSSVTEAFVAVEPSGPTTSAAVVLEGTKSFLDHGLP